VEFLDFYQNLKRRNEKEKRRNLVGENLNMLLIRES
jgi:hypothetical protein